MRLIEQVAIERIKKVCVTKNYEFLGFVGDKLNGNTTKLVLKCNKCGNIWNSTNYSNFTNKHQGCPNCKREHLKKLRTKPTSIVENELKEKCKEKKIEFISWKNEEKCYNGYRTKLVLKCNICGNVWDSTRYDHFVNDKTSCPECAKETISNKLSSNLEDVIEKAKKIHNNLYDYSLIKEYKNNNTPYDIICKKHGKFSMDFTHHIDRGQGCPICNQSKLESDIKNLLDENKIRYVYRAKKKTIPWINSLELDFYLIDYKIGIECQGIQHFKPINFFGGEEEFKNITKRDELKMKLCEKNNVKLLYYSANNCVIDNILNFTSTKDILNEIKKVMN